MKSETEEKYQHYVRTLTERIQTCDTILNQVDETLELFNDLQLQHQAVATKTKTLHDACDRLVMEKQSLIEFAESLCAKLNYFDELENIYRGKRRMCRNRSKRQLNGMIWVLLRCFFFLPNYLVVWTMSECIQDSYILTLPVINGLLELLQSS